MGLSRTRKTRLGGGEEIKGKRKGETEKEKEKERSLRARRTGPDAQDAETHDAQRHEYGPGGTQEDGHDEKEQDEDEVEVDAEAGLLLFLLEAGHDVLVHGHRVL